jgi:hypothetical protein
MGNPADDGTNGTPRTDTETRPINISFVAIFKYKNAPAQTSILQANILYTGQLISQVEELSGNFTITSTTNKTFFPITTGASDYTITLPPLAQSLGRVITITKDDSGAGEVTIDGNGAETINGFSSLYLASQYDSITLIATTSEWIRASGVFQPVSGQPSLGKLHMIAEASRVNWDVNDSTITDTWEECDLSARVPNGTTALYGVMNVSTTNAADLAVICIRDGAGSTTSVSKTETLACAAELGAANTQIFASVTIKATNGVFDYRRYTGFTVNQFLYSMWGYYLNS